MQMDPILDRLTDRQHPDPLMPLPRASDRRSPNRQAVPACSRCRDTVAAVTARTPCAFYCRCPSCGDTWSVPIATRDAQGN